MASVTPKLYLATDNGEVPRERTKTIYTTEEQAQAWLVELRASLIRDGQLGQPPVRWAEVQSQFGPHTVYRGLSQWRMTHILLDEDGVTNFVYRKRDGEAVGLGHVGQELIFMCSDSSRYLNGIEEPRDTFEFRYWRTPVEPALEKLLGLTVSTAIEAFWAQVADNWQRRKLRLIFADATIPVEVRQGVECLNQQLAD